MAYLLGIKVEYINIYPLGGISHFRMPLNINPLKELLVLIMGPIFQLFAYMILMKIFPDKQKIIEFYNWHILLFNLLPIIPLDGGKLLFLLLQKILPYYNSYRITIIISVITTTIILISNRIALNILIMLILLIILIRK